MAAASRALYDGDGCRQGVETRTLMLATVIPLEVIATIMIVASLVFLNRFRDKPIVAMGQPRLLSVMCVGSLLILVGVSITAAAASEGLNRTEKHWKILSGLSDCLCYTGLCTMDLILFFKLFRVYKVTQFRRCETIQPQHIRLPFLLGLMLSLVLSLGQVCTDKRDEKILGESFDTIRKAVAAVNFALNSLFRLGVFVFAYKLRSVDETIGDTRRIMRYAAVTFFLKIPGAVIYFHYDEDCEIKSVILCLLWTLSAMVLPALLVLPRMYLVWHKEEYGKFPSEVQMYGMGEVHVCCKTTATAATASTSTATTAATTSTATTTATTTEPAKPRSLERSPTVHWTDSLIVRPDRQKDEGKKWKDDLECRETEEEENV